MPKYTVDQIADAAESACFYITPGGVWLRMQTCDMDNGTFCALNEDSGEEYMIEFEDMVDEDIRFMGLAPITIGA